MVCEQLFTSQPENEKFFWFGLLEEKVKRTNDDEDEEKNFRHKIISAFT
jgi:hypothetical protein